jgi:amino acid permease
MKTSRLEPDDLRSTLDDKEEPSLFAGLTFLGIAPTSVGAGMIYLPAGLIVFGALVIALAVVYARGMEG